MDIEHKILCAIDDRVYLISIRPLVEYELLNWADIPIEHRTSTGQSLAQFALSAIDGSDPESNHRNKRAFLVAKVLFAKGVDINAVDNLGFSALHNAVASNEDSVATFLLEQGANAELLTTDNFKDSRFSRLTPLQLAQRLAALNPKTDRRRMIEALTHPVRAPK